MRTIKFRAWDKKEKRMFKVYGLTWHFGIFLIEEDGRSQRHGSGETEIMQFTGLLDKNGVEIYEGDIVKGSAFEDGDLQIGEVGWFRNGYDIAGINTDGEFNELLEWIDAGNIEVIGNIYQNKDLLIDKIWLKILAGVQDGKITTGDSYRMKSDLFDEIKKIVSLAQREERELIIGFVDDLADLGGDVPYGELKEKIMQRQESV